MRVVLIAAVLMIASDDGFAQDVKSMTAHERAAAELIDVLQLERLYWSSLDVMEQALMNPAFVPAEQTAMMQTLTDVMVEFRNEFMRWDDFRPEYIRMYQEAFTEAEMRELIAFYRTPVGRKALDVAPDLMRQAMESNQRLMQQHMPELQRRLLLRLRDVEG